MSIDLTFLTGKNWAETFSRVEQELTQALESVEQQQKALDEYLHTASPGETTAPNWLPELEDSIRRGQALPALVERAGDSVADVDTALAEAEAALRQWLEATGAARENLANWLAGAIR